MQVVKNNIAVPNTWEPLHDLCLIYDKNFEFAEGKIYTITNNGAFPVWKAVLAERPDNKVNTGVLIKPFQSFEYKCETGAEVYVKSYGELSSLCIEVLP